MSVIDADLGFMSVKELTHGYEEKKFSPVEVTQAVLAKIEAENSTYNAICFLDPEATLKAAKASEARWQKGEPLSAIDGVPATIKDLVLTKGWPTLKGSLTTDPAGPWDVDAPAVDKLRRAGAVLIGKTTTPEFGSKGVTENLLTGITRNAWNPGKTSGGSSGGAAVAAARGYGPLHLGGDGAGSVRIPASYNSIYSIKPTYGRIPAWPPSALGTVAHPGPMTRTVEDAAYMLSIMSQGDDRDWQALPPDNCIYENNLEKPMTGMKIAYSADLGYADVDPEVASVCRKAAGHFETLGAIVEDIDGPLDEDPVWITDRLWFLAFLKITESMSDKTVSLLDPIQQKMLAVANKMTSKEISEALSGRDQVALRLCQLHRNYDLLLTPTMPQTAFAAGMANPYGTDKVLDWIRWSSFTYPFNQSQQPAASCPCGFDSEGMPIGLQIIGNKYQDLLVMQASKAFEGIAKIKKLTD